MIRSILFFRSDLFGIVSINSLWERISSIGCTVPLQFEWRKT